MKKSTKFLMTLLTSLGLGAFAQSPVVNFSWTPANPCPGATVAITGSITSGTVTAWGYSVTGATATTYTVQNPVVTFTAGGTQTITLVALNGLSPSQPVIKTITVTPNPIQVASTTTMLCVGNSATLTASGGTAYVWSAPLTSTVATAVISPTTTTNYTVSATASVCPGYTWTSVFTQSVSPCTGVAQMHNESILVSVYPNPAKSELVVELNNGTSKSIEVIDVTGKVVLSEVSSKDNTVINVGGLNTGIYFVRVQSNNSVKVLKIVKE